MITYFTAVKEQMLRDFENGKINCEAFKEELMKAETIGLYQIDRAVHVFANNDEFSPYYEIWGSGEILAGGDGEALIMDPIYFENENGSECEICDPAIYMTSDEINRATDILKDVDDAGFKEMFDLRMKKLTRLSFLNKEKKELKKNADDIFKFLWSETEKLKNLYEKSAKNGDFIVIYTIYEAEDFERAES